MSNILDPSFKYVNAAATDIRETFRRERKRLEALKAKQPATPKVTPIKREKR